MELRKYNQFDSIKEMDSYIEEVIECFNLNKTDRLVLRTLATYSCKVIGVSWLKVKSIADILGISPRTVQRSYKRLISLGILERHENFRPVKGGNGASVTVICRTDLSPRQVEEDKHENWLERLLSKLDTINLKQQDFKDTSLDVTYLEGTSVPENFIETVKPYLSVMEIYDLWMKVLRAGKKYAPQVTSIDTISEIAIKAWKQTHFTRVRKKLQKSINAYFYGTVRGMLAHAQRKLHKDKLVDFLSL